MSNDLTEKPYIIDTASATLLSAQRLKIASIRWNAPSASAGHAVSVQTALGRVLWASVATGANYAEAESWPYESPLIADGLKVPTLGSGTLYINVYP